MTALASRSVLNLDRKPRKLLNVSLVLWNMLGPGMRPQDMARLTNPQMCYVLLLTLV